MPQWYNQGIKDTRQPSAWDPREGSPRWLWDTRLFALGIGEIPKSVTRVLGSASNQPVGQEPRHTSGFSHCFWAYQRDAWVTTAEGESREWAKWDHVIYFLYRKARRGSPQRRGDCPLTAIRWFTGVDFTEMIGHPWAPCRQIWFL